MKTTRILSLATAFAVLILTFLVSCGTVGEEGGGLLNGPPESNNPINPSPLSKSSFTLSFAGSSYGDIDKGLTYTTSAVQSVKEKIDLVAYLDASNVIKNPCDVSTIGYLNCGLPAFYSIPAKYHAALRTATIASDIKQFLEADDAISDYAVDEIPISSGIAFAVLSTEGKLYVVVITSAYTQSVTLEFYNPLL